LPAPESPSKGQSGKGQTVENLDQSLCVTDKYAPFKQKIRIQMLKAEENGLLTMETVDLPPTHFKALIAREDPEIEPNARFITKINFKSSVPEKDPATNAVLVDIDGKNWQIFTGHQRLLRGRAGHQRGSIGDGPVNGTLPQPIPTQKISQRPRMPLHKCRVCACLLRLTNSHNPPPPTHLHSPA
jgi:hypothetical protein